MADPAPEESLDSLASKLTTDCFVRIHIGDASEKPYLIQKELLARQTDYFSRGLQSDKFQEGRDGAFVLKDDNVESWRAFLYWLFNNNFHSTADNNASLLIRCWILGDKYNLIRFQDCAMTKLLHLIDGKRDKRSVPTASEIKEAVVGTAPGSKMRLLMAQEAVFKHRTHDNMSVGDFEDLDGYGFFTEYLEAHRKWVDNQYLPFYSRFDQAPGQKEVPYKEFMVGESTKDHAN